MSRGGRSRNRLQTSDLYSEMNSEGKKRKHGKRQQKYTRHGKICIYYIHIHIYRWRARLCQQQQRERNTIGCVRTKLDRNSPFEVKGRQRWLQISRQSPSGMADSKANTLQSISSLTNSCCNESKGGKNQIFFLPFPSIPNKK
jgi:hypothetical protein